MRTSRDQDVAKQIKDSNTYQLGDYWFRAELAYR